MSSPSSGGHKASDAGKRCVKAGANGYRQGKSTGSKIGRADGAALYCGLNAGG